MTGHSVLPDRDVSRETILALQALEALVTRWNPAINLVSKGSLANLWDRHILDSVQLFDLRPERAAHWVDMGSGAGFPGLVVAILAKDAHLQMQVTLVEADSRKATFLREAGRTLGLTVTVLNDRIEALSGLDADVVSARALAPLTDLLAFAAVHLRKGGLAIFPKGARYADEVATAKDLWTFDCETHQSQTEPDAAVLTIRNIERAK